MFGSNIYNNVILGRPMYVKFRANKRKAKGPAANTNDFFRTNVPRCVLQSWPRSSVTA
jgi:hypothetical protein